MLKLIFFPDCHWGKSLHTGLSLEVLCEWHGLQNQFRFVVKNIFSLKLYQMTHMQVTEMSGELWADVETKRKQNVLMAMAFASSWSWRTWQYCGWYLLEYLTGQQKSTKVFYEAKFVLLQKSYAVKNSVDMEDNSKNSGRQHSTVMDFIRPIKADMQI